MTALEAFETLVMKLRRSQMRGNEVDLIHLEEGTPKGAETGQWVARVSINGSVDTWRLTTSDDEIGWRLWSNTDKAMAFGRSVLARLEDRPARIREAVITRDDYEAREAKKNEVSTSRIADYDAREAKKKEVSTSRMSEEEKKAQAEQVEQVLEGLEFPDGSRIIVHHVEEEDKLRGGTSGFIEAKQPLDAGEQADLDAAAAWEKAYERGIQEGWSKAMAVANEAARARRVAETGQDPPPADWNTLRPDQRKGVPKSDISTELYFEHVTRGAVQPLINEIASLRTQLRSRTGEAESRLEKIEAALKSVTHWEQELRGRLYNHIEAMNRYLQRKGEPDGMDPNTGEAAGDPGRVEPPV